MCTTDSTGLNRLLNENIKKLDLVKVSEPVVDNEEDYSSSSDDEEQRTPNADESIFRHLENSRNKIETYKNNSESLNIAQLLYGRFAETILVENSSNVDIGHKFYLNQTNVQQIESLLDFLISQKSREFSPTVSKDFPMISRVRWLAQPALEPRQYLKEPAKYVIIGHTATEEGYDQAKNILLIRIAQTYHIESQHWADIAYNFMIGSDGNVYEGRGWKAIGAHTQGYNLGSVGISFVGCFLKHLPPRSAMKKCQDLIAHGVEMGYISPNYQLLAHRQCRPFQSPGDSLFKEIQTWKNWNPNISVKDPAPYL